ncbi:MAG: hypothetical protein JW812_02970 [Alphaproteobacteria bacterium]|nr:hypothetical protein [Alphaproteobacteria bacterium]
MTDKITDLDSFNFVQCAEQPALTEEALAAIREKNKDLTKTQTTPSDKFLENYGVIR